MATVQLRIGHCKSLIGQWDTRPNAPRRISRPTNRLTRARARLISRAMSMMKEFKEFALRGNVVDLAVGVIIGAAFGKIVTSVVTDILMPPIGKAMGGVNFADLFINLDPGKTLPNGAPITSLAQAKNAGAAV